LSTADKTAKAIEDGTKIVAKLGGLMGALGSLLDGDDEYGPVSDLNTTTN
jgi:hypothetical protein